MRGILESLLSADWVREQLAKNALEFWVWAFLVLAVGYVAGRWHADRIDRHELECLRVESRHVLSRQAERMREVTAAHERRMDRLRDELEAEHSGELAALSQSYESRIAELEAERNEMRLETEHLTQARVERENVERLMNLPSQLRSILKETYDAELLRIPFSTCVAELVDMRKVETPASDTGRAMRGQTSRASGPSSWPWVAVLWCLGSTVPRWHA